MNNCITIKNNAEGLTKENAVALWNSVGWSTGSVKFPDRLLAALQNSSAIFTAWDGDELIGLCSAIDDGLNAWISYMVVDSRYHNQGTGGILVEKMIDNYSNFRLFVQTRKAEKFYIKHGFEKTMTSLRIDGTVTKKG